MPKAKKPRKLCSNCLKETKRANYLYCSNLCQREFEYKSFIKDWKIGKVDGLVSIGIVSKHIKRYLRDKFGNKCVLCGWAEVHRKTGLVPLVADHVDGNWRNNIESNLRLLCPNCDSLTSTYAGLNRGNGRLNRSLSKRAIEGKKLKISRSSSVGRALLS